MELQRGQFRLLLFYSRLNYLTFENRFITNYELRNENSHGVRTWLEVVNHKEGLINQ